MARNKRLRSDADVQDFLLTITEEIIGELTEWVVDKLKDSMDEKVYNHPEGRYDQQKDNGGLRSSFDNDENRYTKLKPKRQGLSVTGIIAHDPESMVHYPTEFIHGSSDGITETGGAANYPTNDIRDILIDIIIHNGNREAGTLFGEGYWRKKRDFWTPVLKIVTRNELDDQFYKRLKKKLSGSGMKITQIY